MARNERSSAPVSSLESSKLIAALLGADQAPVQDVGPGDLQVLDCTVGAHAFVAVVFDYAKHHGSIGRLEADQLAAALKAAARSSCPIVLLMNTSGIRVTDGTAGIASLRKVLQHAEDARLDGVRMLALIQKNAFGGASILAAMCEGRVIHRDCLYAMSGPRLIEAVAGPNAFDARDKAAVAGLLGGQARATASNGFHLVDDSTGAYRQALEDWLASPTADKLTLAQLRQANQALAARVPEVLPQPVSVPQTLAVMEDEAAVLLRQVLPGAAGFRSAGNVVEVSAAPGDAVAAIVLNTPAGTDFRDTVTLTSALLRLLDGPHFPDRCMLIVDSESHVGAPRDEQLVLSEALAQLALTIRWLHRSGCHIEVVVSQLGGGGILAALGSGATRVSMGPQAQLRVLPRSAMQALNKSEDPAAGSLAVAMETGAVDGPFTSASAPAPAPAPAPERVDPGNQNFYELFASQVRANPAAACLETDEGATLSRGWLDQQSSRFANALAAAGCTIGDRIAVQVDKSPEALALYLGCVRAGLCFLPLNTAYLSTELAHVIADASPRLIICRPDRRNAVVVLVADGAPPRSVMTLDAQGQGSLADAAAAHSPVHVPVARAGDDPAALLYTSGTTGRPKGALISHRAMNYCAGALGQAWHITQEDVLLHALPLFHGHGLFISTNVALAAGAKILFQSRFDVATVIAALPATTIFMAVPTYYSRLLAEASLDRAMCARMRLFTSGSAPLSAEVHREFEARTGHRILERYGATETMILCANPLNGERRPGSVGLPLPGVALRIADADDAALPSGEIGMIEVRGPGLFSGYWNMPEQTALEFTADGYFRTGDLGAVDADGYVSITGRSKDLIISGGYNVYPAEVEAILNEHPDISESAVIGIPHADFGEAVIAIVIARVGSEPLQTAEVLVWAKARLANFKVPKRVIVAVELPRNAMGKVLKNELRRMHADLSYA